MVINGSDRSVQLWKLPKDLEDPQQEPFLVHTLRAPQTHSSMSALSFTHLSLSSVPHDHNSLQESNALQPANLSAISIYLEPCGISTKAGYGCSFEFLG